MRRRNVLTSESDQQSKFIFPESRKMTLIVIKPASLYIWTSIILIGTGWNGPSSYVIAEEKGLTPLETVAKSNTDFASAMYRVLTEGAEDGQNLIFSPYSISTVMAMLKLGANGTTAIDIRNAMKYPENYSTLFQGYKELVSLLNTHRSTDDVAFEPTTTRGSMRNKVFGQAITLDSVNKIFPQTGIILKDNFASNVNDYFSTTIDQINFSNSNGIEATRKINGYIDDRVTKRNKIFNVVHPGQFDKFTKLVVVSSIYFKGTWKYKFKERETKEEDFRIIKGTEKSVKVPMMRMEHILPYAEIPELNAKVVGLPYKDEKFWMIILLPNDPHKLKELEYNLWKISPSELHRRLKNDTLVNLKIPKFKLESTLDLKEHLMKLGLTSIFNPRLADFSNITNDDLHVSEALYKAVIEVNEKGSEEATFTGRECILWATKMGLKLLRGNSSMVVPPVKKMHINHPFIAIITYKLGESSEHEILFMNRVASPLPPSKSADRMTGGERNPPFADVVKRTTKLSKALGRVLLQCPMDNQNVIFSPHGINMVLFMLKLRSNGRTENDIKEVIGDTDAYGYKQVFDTLKGTTEFTLQPVARIYTQAGYELSQVFPTISQLDFSNGDLAAKEINGYVRNKTGDKIKGVVEPREFNRYTSMVVVTVLYVKGVWKYGFEKGGTEDFYIGEEGQNVKVPMMKVRGRFRYSDNPELGAKAVALPYKDERFFMIILLPYEMDGLKKTEAMLLNPRYPLDNLPRDMFHRHVNVEMPRFKVESAIDLEEPLTKVGVGSIFDKETADFSRILNNNQTLLHVSKAVEKVVIEVDEEGGEPGGNPRPTPLVEGTTEEINITINHPFLLILAFNPDSNPECGYHYLYIPRRYKCQYQIMLMGKVSNPQASS